MDRREILGLGQGEPRHGVVRLGATGARGRLRERCACRGISDRGFCGVLVVDHQRLGREQLVDGGERLRDRDRQPGRGVVWLGAGR